MSDEVVKVEIDNEAVEMSSFWCPPILRGRAAGFPESTATLERSMAGYVGF